MKMTANAMTPPRNTDLRYEESIEAAIRAIKAGEELNVPAASDTCDVNRRTLYWRHAGTSLS